MNAWTAGNQSYAGPIGQIRVRTKGRKRGQGYLYATGGKITRTVPGGGTSESSWVFAQVVHHPGTQPRPFFEVTIVGIMPQIRQIIAGQIQDTLGWGGAGVSFDVQTIGP